MNLGKRIAHRLNELGWERTDLLARVPDLTPQALSNLIKRDSVRSEWDVKIAEALGVPILWLVYGELYSPAERSTLLAAREPENVVYFPASATSHAAIDEVLKLMSETDELGRGMMLAKVRDIAEERKAFTNKLKSST